MIEALTYRMGAHTTSDDPTRYRTSADEDYWRERDPIARLEAHLKALGELPDEFVESVQAECKEMGKRTREAVRSWPKPAKHLIFEHVYAEPHARVEAERAVVRAIRGDLRRCGGGPMTPPSSTEQLRRPPPRCAP